MAYISEVFYAFAWPDKNQAKVVLNAYKKDQKVIKTKCFDSWEFYTSEHNNYLVSYFHSDYIKWYQEYQAMECLESYADFFWHLSKFPYACKFSRLGEDPQDQELRFWHAGDASSQCYDWLQDFANVSTHMFDTEIDSSYEVYLLD
jgi:hypothetical protein